MLHSKLIRKLIEESLLPEDADDVAFTIVEMFLDWNGSEAASDADTRSRTQEAVSKVLFLLKKHKSSKNNGTL